MKLLTSFILIFIIFNTKTLAQDNEINFNEEEIEKELKEKTSSNDFSECSNQYSALVFREDNDEILYSKRAEQIIYPASLVKLMTLYLTFEAIENNRITPEDKIFASERAQEISEVNKINTLHLVAGDQITVKEAIRALIVKSFNEAAVMLSEAISENEWNFVRKMNQKASELGMINSSFKNSSGLHEEGQYTTAYDLARLAKALKKDFPRYYHLFSLKEFKYSDKIYPTHNHVLVDYKGAEGMKTGFTRASGFNLITSAKKGKNRLISILASCASYEKRDDFMIELLDHSFKKIANNESSNIKLHKEFDYKNTRSKDIVDESDMRFEMVVQ